MFCLRLCCGPKWRGGSAGGWLGVVVILIAKLAGSVHDARAGQGGAARDGAATGGGEGGVSADQEGLCLPARVGRVGVLLRLLEPLPPQAVDVGVVQPEDRVQRGCVRAVHQASWAADVVVHRVVGGVLEGSALRLAVLQEEL